MRTYIRWLKAQPGPLWGFPRDGPNRGAEICVPSPVDGKPYGKPRGGAVKGFVTLFPLELSTINRSFLRCGIASFFDGREVDTLS